jgi:hypothetical protein
MKFRKEGGLAASMEVSYPCVVPELGEPAEEDARRSREIEKHRALAMEACSVPPR